MSHREGMIFHGAVEYPKTALVFAALRGHVPQVKELKAGSGGVRENDRGTAALRKEKGFLKQQNGRVSSVLQGNISFARFKDIVAGEKAGEKGRCKGFMVQGNMYWKGSGGSVEKS